MKFNKIGYDDVIISQNMEKPNTVTSISILKKGNVRLYVVLTLVLLHEFKCCSFLLCYI